MIGGSAAETLSDKPEKARRKDVNAPAHEKRENAEERPRREIWRRREGLRELKRGYETHE